jgi:hypothetical protein
MQEQKDLSPKYTDKKKCIQFTAVTIKTCLFSTALIVLIKTSDGTSDFK